MSNEQPQWTPEQQATIACLMSLDRVSRVIASWMMDSDLSLATVMKLMPLAELAWRNQDPAGVVVFFDIHTPSPSVRYVRGTHANLLLYIDHPDRYAIPLRPVLELAMGRPVSSRMQ